MLAVIAAMPMTLMITMNECQLSATKQLAEECFARSSVSGKVYLASLVIAGLIAVTLRVRRSKWAWLALVLIPVGPVAAIVGLSALTS